MKLAGALFIVVILLVSSVVVLANTKKVIPVSNQTNILEKAPELSGWIPWWDEKKGYDLIQKYPNKIKSVSPVWFMVGENFTLSDIGTVDRKVEIQLLKNSKVKIYPTLGSELSEKELSLFLNDKKKSDALIKQLASDLEELDVDGADIDLESITKKDRQAFTTFLETLELELAKKNLKLSVTIHAQDGKTKYLGNEGQDLYRIGRLADEVRIMTYDEHSASSDAGPIASLNWISDVASYTSFFISRDKLVFGIPSYGYIWNDDPNGLQFDEFNEFVSSKSYTTKRNNESGELVFTSDDFKGYLSDSQAMKDKIKTLQVLGFNKFVIWHLGGLDEKLFEDSF